MKRLGVNIDHIATLRNARGEKHPDPLYAAKKVISYGADSVTIHLREDRRHINDIDAKKICGLRNVPVNLEISMNKEICLLYTSPSPRDLSTSRMPSSA